MSISAIGKSAKRWRRPSWIVEVQIASRRACRTARRDRRARSHLRARRRLPTNARDVCAQSNAGDCGVLEPQLAGIIYDEDHFRVDLFINPNFVRTSHAGPTGYLPAPSRSLSLTNSFALDASGTIGGGSGLQFPEPDHRRLWQCADPRKYVACLAAGIGRRRSRRRGRPQRPALFGRSVLGSR